MQVGEAISERFIVHFERPIVSHQRSRDCQNIAPIRASLSLVKLGWFADVSSAPYDQRIAALNIGTLQVCVSVGAFSYAHAILVRVRSAGLTHFAIDTLDQVI